MKGGTGKLKFLKALSTIGVEFVTLPLWIGKNHSEGIDTFDIRSSMRCIQLNFSPSIVGQSLEFVAVKLFRKVLGKDDHHDEWTAR